jgi:O-antigen/teichoic acid export membrane protein
LAFCSWDIYGNLACTSRAQGVLVVLNKFGGTVLNAAGGLCLTVASTISSFAGSITTAFRPQIIQQYAKGNYPYMLQLLNNCARYSLLLLGLLIIPIIIGMDGLLDLWLVEPPRFTSVFCRIALAAVCGELLTGVLSVGVHATGNVKRVSFITGTLYVIELPIMWLLLKITENPPIVYCVHLVMIFVIVYVNSLILKVQLHAFSVTRFWHRGVFTPMLILAVNFAVTYLLSRDWPMDILHLIVIGVISTVIMTTLSWFFAIDDDLRDKVKNKFRTKLNRGA